MLRLASLAGLVLAIAPSIARAESPQLDSSRSTICMDDPSGQRVHVQCDGPSAPAGTCYFAAICAGSPCRELERLQWCNEAADGERWADLVAKGYVFVPARAEVLPGFYRDEEGRAFQVNFDLNNRMWIGGSYLHTFSKNGDGFVDEGGGALLEMGFRAEYTTDDGRARSRFHAFELTLATSPLQVHGTLLRYDSSNIGEEPLVRLTTFIGGPARHDIYLQGGWWMDLLTVDHRPRGSVGDTQLRIIGGGVTWDLFQDADMTSYLRIKLGLGLDDAFLDKEERGRFVVAPLAALEGDFTFDDEGFHHLTLSSRFEAAFIEDTAGDGFDYHRRFENEIAYELILIAIDDQPVTLRVGVNGGYRDDLVANNGWAIAAQAGLRVSFWAPPRDLAERDRRRVEAVVPPLAPLAPVEPVVPDSSLDTIHPPVDEGNP